MIKNNLDRANEMQSWILPKVEFTIDQWNPHKNIQLCINLLSMRSMIVKEWGYSFNVQAGVCMLFIEIEYITAVWKENW